MTQINAARAAQAVPHMTVEKTQRDLVEVVGGHGGPDDPEEQAAELMGAVGRMISR